MCACMKPKLQKTFPRRARRNTGVSFVQISVLLIGLAVAATMAFMPAQLASQILHPGAPAIGGGISEEQILDPSVAEDPDAVSTTTGTTQSSSKAAPSSAQPAANGEYPLRSYWWYPLAAAGGLFILLAFAGKPVNAASVAQGHQATQGHQVGQSHSVAQGHSAGQEHSTLHHRPESHKMPAQKPPLREAPEPRIETPKAPKDKAQGVPHTAPYLIHADESADRPKPQSNLAPTATSRPEPDAKPKSKPEPKKQSSEPQTASAKVSKPTPLPASKIANTSASTSASASAAQTTSIAVTQNQMLEFAKVLSHIKEENLLSEDEYKAIHAAFQATDNTGKKWTVNLKTRGWFEKVDGKWQTATPPDTLYLNRKTNDSLLKYAKQLESKH
jgi:hypothetical protein